jgi:hypothetical protein
MKHTTEELLLANAVIERAASLYANAMPSNMTAEQRTEWRSTHPLNDFIIPGLEQLEKVAVIIKSRPETA